MVACRAIVGERHGRSVYACRPIDCRSLELSVGDWCENLAAEKTADYEVPSTTLQQSTRTRHLATGARWLTREPYYATTTCVPGDSCNSGTDKCVVQNCTEFVLLSPHADRQIFCNRYLRLELPQGDEIWRDGRPGQAAGHLLFW